MLGRVQQSLAGIYSVITAGRACGGWPPVAKNLWLSHASLTAAQDDPGGPFSSHYGAQGMLFYPPFGATKRITVGHIGFWRFRLFGANIKATEESTGGRWPSQPPKGGKRVGSQSLAPTSQRGSGRTATAIAFCSVVQVLRLNPGFGDAFYAPLGRSCGHGGVTGPGSLTPTPPPPPGKLGGKCWTIGTKGAVSNSCLMWQRVKKMCFHPMCLYSIYLEF